MRDLFIKTKIALDRGREWISYINFFLIVFIAVANLKQYSYFDFLQTRYWMIIILFLTFFGIIILGWFDVVVLKTFQFQSKKMAQINPVWVELMSEIKSIKNRLNEIEKKLDDKN